MLRRRKLDPERARAQRDEARRAAEAAAARRAEVETESDEIMAEVARHKRMLRVNNFAWRVHKALGGEGS